MSGLVKILLVVVACATMCSENLGKAVFYSYCLLNDFRERSSFFNLGIVSILFDVYYSLAIGLSFLSFVVVIKMVERFESVLSNLLIEVRINYLFLIVVLAELVYCLFTELLGGKFHFYSHFILVVESMFFYCIFESLKRHARR